MKLKLDENGHVVVEDGKPVYVHDDGKELPFDAVYTVGTIKRLNSEAQGYREAKEQAEKALKVFDGLNADEARKALETIKSYDGKKLADAGEIEKLKAELGQSFKDSYEPQLAELRTKAEQAEQALQRELIGGGFARSKFISEKIAIPADMMQNTFGQNFKIEEGKTVAYDANGQKIYSRSNPSELASFDEALELLVGGYSHKDSILKGSQSQGAGFSGSQGGGGVKRSLADCKTKEEKVAFLKTVT